MRLRSTALLLAAGAVLVGLGGPAANAQDSARLSIEATDAAAYPTVTLEVAAPSGLDGADIDPAGFTLTEDGATRTITAERVPTDNLEILLVIDTSGSMRGEPLAAAKRAVADFLGVLPAEVRVGAVGFGADASLVAAPTVDRLALATAVDGLQANGDTALYDAVAFSVDRFTEAATDRAIVLLSDGGDTASFLDLPTAVEAAGGGVRFSVISLLTDTTNADALQQIAEAGRGTVSSVADPASLADLYRATAGAILNRYRISYQSSAYDAAQVVVRLDTAAGPLEASTQIGLPAAPVTVPTTQPPAPPTTPAPTQPPTTPAPVIRTADGVDDGAIRMRLLIGLGSLFVAIFLVVFLAMPRDRATRRARANLVLSSGSVPQSSSAAMKERLSTSSERLVARSGRGASLARALDRAGLTFEPGEFVLIVLAAVGFGALLGLLAGGVLTAMIAALVVILLARALVQVLADQRREKFLEQLPDTLQMVTSSLRSGFGLMQAIDSVAGQVEHPMRGELKKVLLEQRVGADLPSSLHRLSERMESKDFEWVAGAIEINRDVGGDLAAILDNVAITIRDRRHLARQVRTLSAEGRISAYVLLCLPIAVALVLGLTNPTYLGELGSPTGIVLVAGAAGLMGIGWVWMRRLVKVDY